MEREVGMEMGMQTHPSLNSNDVTTQITGRGTGGGQKFGYYAAILGAKKGRGLHTCRLVPSRE